MNLSIVVPAYNAAETLGKCLTAIFTAIGSRTDYEVIVVNDGSADNTAEIARGFPVRLLQSSKNSGRIQAREKGARAAKSSNILFVDARIKIPQDIFETLDKLNYEPVMGGTTNLNRRDGRPLDRLLFLLRKRIYAPYYPQSPENPCIWLNEHNFGRVPKGMGTFYVEKSRFLKALPENRSGDVNDDSRMFRDIIREKEILVSGDIRQVYMQREPGWPAYRHIFERGPKFADFYLQPGGKYYPAWILIIIGFILGCAAMVLNPGAIFVLAGIGVLSALGITCWLAEKLTDVLRIPLILLAVAALFGSGILKGKFIQFRRAPATAWNRRMPIILVLAVFICGYLLSRESFAGFHIEHWMFLPLLGLLDLAMLTVNGLVLKVFLAAFDIRLRPKEWFGLAAMTAMASYLTTGAGGATLRAAVLKRKFKFPYSRFLAVLATNYLLNFFLAAIFGLGVYAILYMDSEINVWQLPVFFVSIAVSTLILLFFRIFPTGKTGRIGQMVNTVYEGWDFLRLQRRALGKIALLLISNFLLYALSLIIGFATFSVTLPGPHALLMAVLSSFSGIIALTPANLGIREAVTGFATYLVGFGFYHGLTVVAVLRIVSIFNIFLFGPILSYQLLKKTKHSVGHAESMFKSQ